MTGTRGTGSHLAQPGACVTVPAHSSALGERRGLCVDKNDEKGGERRSGRAEMKWLGRRQRAREP